MPILTHANSVGQFQHFQDIGNVQNSGSLSYNESLQTYRMSGSGENMWLDEDQFAYAWREVAGDFIVRAQFTFTGKGQDPHRKIGWHVREALTTDAKHINATTHGDGLTALQFRAKAGASTEEYHLAITQPDVLQLERRGNQFIMSAARMGEPFQVTSVSHIEFDQTVYVGLALCAHKSDAVETANISNVRFIKPAAADFVPYRDYIGSNLEILDLTTLQRRVVYQAEGSIQAPNWTPDNQSLIFNADGKLFKFNLNDHSIRAINTGFATNNNNDHVLSFDGKYIGISHHAQEEDGRSTIYTLPITGSDEPRQITKPGAGHSYLHGFSPDGSTLIFTGHRKGQYDIYAVDIANGEESQLTNTKTLDDGSEYGPDGEFIYFNSNRTGTMQLWRMRPDGSGQQQLTFDRYNDWFPHVSPDGKSLVFLSYMADIDSGDHPFYKPVYLRRMPAEGGEPTVIAYVYGGQGTINVPSWSPDGRYIAFVSNTRH
ncbi:hypothetical protein QWI17_01110 [Gilvimarinus sp. SDUM040013]|uniref:Biopolymer transporter TolR n=1 Tax=Gilvimarinus gilvus TaxID=3058038 RepID=A0ABU4S3L5_9GAMM|nr:hypothetical protein [Gilvimarinus sp. SDUM040013]MDO3384429.1 hypothetical protein [Gilvimarinus sp. SDUM040013]MDX6851102.1 hypothetical protein [Gilvimarinus sp. SDUM040013]